MTYRPPFEVTPRALSALTEIMRLVGRHEGLMSPTPQPQLRRQNQIRTLHGSLAIEGNTLTEDQITAIIGGKRVAGRPREILEVRNAIATYAAARRFDPTKSRDLLAAHRRMMKGLIDDAGKYRAKGAGIFAGPRVAHMAPPAKQVRRLIDQVFAFLKSDRRTHPIVKSAVIHYELEFIHPFSDGNGRMGRFWQHVVLIRQIPVFEFVPIESVIRARQQEYYRVLGICDQAGNSSRFVEFSLETIHQSLAELLAEIRVAPLAAAERLQRAREHFAGQVFSRKDYLSLFPTLSTATASRDLREGVDQGLLVKSGDRALTRYRFR